MNNPAPLHANISNQLNQMGQKTTPGSVNPDDQTPLENIKQTLGEAAGDAVHIAGTAGTILGGEEQSTYIRTAPDRKFLSLAKERIKRLFKKAA